MNDTLSTIRDISIEKGIQTGPFGSQLKSDEYSDTGIPVIMPKDIKNGRINKETAVKIPESKAKALSKHAVQIGDIVFSRRGDLSSIGVVDSETEGCICGTGCLRARLSEKVYPGYIHHYAQFETTTKWLKCTCS